MWFSHLDLIWDPPNLQELGPLKFIGVYNLPPAFWPASLKDKVKNLGIDVDETNRADPSSSVPHKTFEELLENLDFSTLSPHANVDIFEILGLSVDGYSEQNEIDAVIKQEEEEDKFWLTPNVNHNNGAAAFDSEELLSYIASSRKRKRAVSSDNDCFSSANESFAMFDDFELFESPRAKPRLDSNEYVEDILTTLCTAVFSDQSTVYFD